MEPVFMILGQSAAAAAFLAIDNPSGIVQEVDYQTLAEVLKKENQIMKIDEAIGYQEAH
jgi:hypothetical protein